MINVISKFIQSNIMQDSHKSIPGHWLLPSPLQPHLEDLNVDAGSISPLLPLNRTDDITAIIVEQQDAKIVEFDTNFLCQVDVRFRHWKGDELH